jgi:hypothetical protein
MVETIQEAFLRLRALGTPEELEGPFTQAPVAAGPLKANSHIHLPPNFSAFQSAEHAVRLAAEQRVSILGTSNYYDFSVYAQFAAEASRRRVFPLFGLEIITLLEDLASAGLLINDPGNPGRMYICGKGIVRFDAMSPAAEKMMQQIRGQDAERMRRMVERLGEAFAVRGVAIDLSEDRIIDSIVLRCGLPRNSVCLQERHVAQAFQEAFFELVPLPERIGKLSRVLGTPSKAEPEDHVKVQHEIRAHLMKVGKPAFVSETFVSFDQAYDLILELGGIPCYPTLADGARPICAYEDPPEKLIELLRSNRIHAVEFIPNRNQPAVLERYVVAMRRAGLVVTAGTEHNTNDLIPIEPMCIGGAPVPQNVEEIFSEGTCVVAAHQFLALHGPCGYVDASGDLHPGFATHEERIRKFHGLGAALIARYHQW